ncbi:MAG TPA: choice-of-anchor tandem repeat GloVer-containing protein, partial [Chthonomonadaceae bacterium]|nr:choice-of-anchor tandem repeat GloVer-containing protein [Chthonomonadaceae bacterium]
FIGKADGANPQAGLMLADDGNFYGTTRAGGPYDKGTVFRITPDGKETVLHAFIGKADGANPQAGLFEGWDNNFYGTTCQGGDKDKGTVFRITRDGTVTILHAFTGFVKEGDRDGANPRAGLTQGTDGNFYGTTTAGGANDYGTVFQVTADGTLILLYSFQGADGKSPVADLMTGTNGCLYGTATSGGVNGKGTAFYLDLALPIVASDFNADLQSELIFQNKTSGRLAMWYMQKYSHNEAAGGEYISPDLPSGWNAVATTYLKDQLHPTLLLHNPTTGQLAFWEMNGNTAVRGEWIHPAQDKNWKPIAMADFNGDGQPDILFQNPTTGQLAIWYMNGNDYASGAFVYPVQDPAWKAVGVTDLNGDGQPDILFQNPTTGQLAIWYMNGNNAVAGEYVTPTQDPAWQAVMVGDFDRDGLPDILFQNPTTGQLCFWYMEGRQAIGGDYIYPMQDPNWRIIGSH